MIGLKYIETYRDYLDYLERHLNNVERAFKLLEKKCSRMKVFHDDFWYWTLREEVYSHDISKFSPEEFTQYALYFKNKMDFLDTKEIEENFKKAYEHHVIHNNHHWENWTKSECNRPHYQDICCTHMVIDVIAMSFEFKDDPLEYFRSKYEKTTIPEWAQDYIEEIFKCVGNVHEEEENG